MCSSGPIPSGIFLCLSVCVLNRCLSTASSSLFIHANVWFCALVCGAVHPLYIAALCLTALILLYDSLVSPPSPPPSH